MRNLLQQGVKSVFRAFKSLSKQATYIQKKSNNLLNSYDEEFVIDEVLLLKSTDKDIIRLDPNIKFKKQEDEVIFLAEKLTIIPKAGDQIVIGDETFNIANPISADPADLTYTLTLRKIS